MLHTIIKVENNLFLLQMQVFNIANVKKMSKEWSNDCWKYSFASHE